MATTMTYKEAQWAFRGYERHLPMPPVAPEAAHEDATKDATKAADVVRPDASARNHRLFAVAQD